jgi:hypothetical protein
MLYTGIIDDWKSKNLMCELRTSCLFGITVLSFGVKTAV